MLKLYKMLVVLGCVFAIGEAASNDIQVREEVEVVVSGVEPKSGVVAISIFDEAEKFLEEPIVYERVNVAGNSELTVTVKLAPGIYAINVYHDLDEDGELDKNLFGIPKEPIAFSNGAVAKMGPPSFADAAIDTNAVKVINIRFDAE